jgi:beta-glucosidase
MNYEKSDLTDGSKWTPMHLTVVLSSAICFSLLLIGCSDGSNDGNTINIDNNDSLEQEVNDLVAQMTIEEKVAQMSGDKAISLPGDGILWNVPGLERLDIPPLKMSDGPRGVTAALGATTFPVGMARGATWDPALEQRVGAAMGRELKAIGGNVLLAPTINILRHPSWGRSQETYSEDVHHLSRMAIASIQGVQEYVLANPKHYTANSIEDTRFEVDVSVDERSLREIYLPQFRAAVTEGGAASVMTSYNSVNGQFCSENEQLLRQILKTEWDFDGFVLSDWFLGTKSTLGAVLNGLDLEMPQAKVYGDNLLTAVADGLVDEALVDEAVSRMVRKKLEYKLGQPGELDQDVLGSDAHLALAQEAATKGSVLLKNTSDALPLGANALERIVVVGVLADTANTGDNGSSNTRPAFVVTPLQGIEEFLGDQVTVEHIGKDTLDPGDLARIESADAVIVVTGLTSEDEGEGLIGAGDRLDLGLSPQRVQLILDAAEANDRAIVVLEGGGAITMGDWLPEVEALLMVWYPGQMAGHAIADLLFGQANPSGKLPITFPTSLDQLPPFDNESLVVIYDYFHGYRYLDRNGSTPEFPFGFGLSYTSFAIDNLRASKAQVSAGDVVQFSVDVTNTGARAGAEVVQVYATYTGSAVERAELELKGFGRIFLEPGETRTVDIPLVVNSLAYYDVEQSAWLVEALEQKIYVGTSSRDLPASIMLSVAAGQAVSL